MFKKYFIIFFNILFFFDIGFAQNHLLQFDTSKVININIKTDSTEIALIAKQLYEINNSLNKQNKLIKNNSDKYILFFSLLLNILLAYIAFRQYKIILSNEKSYLTGNTFVETKAIIIDNIENYLMKSKFYLQLVNIGKLSIDQIWIKFPDNFKIKIKDKYYDKYNSDIINIIRIDEPLLPKEKKIYLFNKDDFFNNNFKLFLNNEKNIFFLIKFKNYKEKKYNQIKIPINIEFKKENVIPNYILSIINARYISKGKYFLYSDNLWNKL